MIEVKRRKINKKHLAIIVTAGVLVLLIAAYVIINAVLNSLSSNNGSGGNAGGSVDYDASIGESVSNNSPAIYPHIERSRIQKFSVNSHKDSFIIKRATDSAGKPLNYFRFYYDVYGDGYYYLYDPDITSAEDGFNYTDFYAIETSDGLNVPKIDYLFATAGSLSYNYKVAITGEKGSSERENQLELYGLDEDSRELIIIDYLDKDGKAQQHNLFIGDKLLNGIGYYVMLDGRDYIYASGGSQNFSYALAGFESFLHSRVVAAGLDDDKTFEPYLTTGYEQWKSYYYNSEGDVVSAGSEVIILADKVVPVYKTDASLNIKPADDGYYHYGYREMSKDLGSLSADPSYSRLIAALVGKSVDKDKRPEDKVVTVVDGMNAATLYDAEKNKGVYKYTIKAIDSILTDTDELFAGTVGENNLIKVSYDFEIDGVRQNEKTTHAVIDLSDANTLKVIPASAVSAIREASVGALAENIEFSVSYTKENANSQSIKYVITEISSIIKLTENNVLYPDKVEADSIVILSYDTVVITEGKETVVDSFTDRMLDLSEITEGTLLELKNKLIGKGVGVTEKISVPVGEVYYQAFMDFTEYRIKQILGFVERELSVAFRFENESERDAFFGETSYTNTINDIDSSNPHGLYALNVEACDAVVRLLGGIKTDGSSQVSEGLVGLETIEVGLNPSIMREKRIYEGHMIHFELPRDIGPDPHNSKDYIWERTLEFNLYVSPTDEDGFRYIASDMYDIVVKIDGSSFDYLDESFVDLWARKTLAAVDHTKLDRVGVDLNFSDLTGKYSFALKHETHYILDGKHYYEQQNGQGAAYNFVTVTASIDGYVKGEEEVEGVYSKSGLSELLTRYNEERFTLAEVYNHLHTDTYQKLSIGNDTMGTAYFKEFLMVLYATYYMGSVDVESDEVKAALANEALLSISFDVGASSVINTYVYDFHRLDDRRVIVSFYVKDSTGATSMKVSDLYISDFAFEKIVRNLLNMLDGKVVNPDIGYGELQGQ